MRTDWDPERVVGLAEARGLVDAVLPGARVRHLADGWDDTVYAAETAADGVWAFHFPRRAMAVEGARREVRWLPRLAPLMTVPVPVPERLGSMPGPSGATEPWPYWGGRLVPGDELAHADGPRAAVAADVGAFLRALHGAEVAAVVGDALRIDPLRRADPAVRVPMARTWLSNLEQAGAWVPSPAVLDLLTDAEAAGAAASTELVVSHGDLHLRHLLVVGGRLSGVIDWGDLCRADPSVDLSVAYGAFAGPDRAALLDAYGHRVPADRDLRARMLAVMLCAALADHAVVHGSPAVLAEALRGIARAVSA